jgi:hypothetical protein
MKTILPFLLVVCSSLVALPAQAGPIDQSLKNAVLGKWKQEMVGARTGGAIIEIASLDQETGRLTGTYVPPSGAAVGQRFDLVGWISSAPPQEKADNVTTVAFTVSLAAYGSISSETGYLKDGKIYAMWHNVRPNAAYDWAHIATGEDIWTKMP